MTQWIDIHEDIGALIYGDHRTVPQGHWAVFRLMKIGEYSRFWDPVLFESRGGPKWEYNDHTIRVLNAPRVSLGRAQHEGTLSFLQGFGISRVGVRIYGFLPYDLPRLPTEYDLIYDIDKAHSKDKPSPPYRVIGRYKITHVFPVRGDDGRIEIVLLNCTTAEGRE